MKARQQRLAIIVLGLLVVGLATALILNALKGNLSYFYSPTQVAEGKAPPDHVFRLGGMVEKGSLKRKPGSMTVHFKVTDFRKTMEVSYTGILPDLFSEGQGVIAQGKLGPNHTFIADEVLAKHDANYMPPEVAAELSKAQKANLQGGAAQ